VLKKSSGELEESDFGVVVGFKRTNVVVNTSKQELAILKAQYLSHRLVMNITSVLSIFIHKSQQLLQ